MGEVLEQGTGISLEQIYLDMPQVKFYFNSELAINDQNNNLTAYIGNEQLTFQTLDKFSTTGESINYYVLLDVSASISHGEFDKVTEALRQCSHKLRDIDKMTLITFGDDVKQVFELTGAELSKGNGDELILALENKDQTTSLFEAVSQVAQMVSNSSSVQSARQVLWVITDGEDFTLGKSTDNEALTALQNAGVPAYGFAVEEANKDYVNAFGEFVRTSGGNLTILENDNELVGFTNVVESMLNSYVAQFEAKSNQVSNGKVNVSLRFEDSGVNFQREVLQNRWIADVESPVITSADIEENNQIKVTFSEMVTGAEIAENYSLESEDGGVVVPIQASISNDYTSAILTFQTDIYDGSYNLYASGIYDQSMEQNEIQDVATILVEGKGSSPIPETESSNFMRDYGWAVVLGILVIFIVCIIILWRWFIKKQKVVVINDEMALEKNVEVRHHVAMQSKNLDEKKIWIHVKGQKEEIPLTIHQSMIVGRSSTCELHFDDKTMSRQHFALELNNNAVWISNLSTSGVTKLNGKTLGTEKYKLNLGDEIEAGQIKMNIRW